MSINGKQNLNSGNVSNNSNATISFELACVVATTANLTATYNNGTAGVGATLTNSGALAAFSVDSQSPSAGARILVKDQSTQAQNGIYVLTTVGSGAVAWVLTRASDYDTTSEINSGDIIAVTSGEQNTGTLWRQTATVTTIGTDAITFAAFFLPSNYVLKSGDTMTGNLSFSGDNRRITGDFSNSTRQNRLSFKTSTTNGNTLVQAMPDGSAVISGFIAYGGSDANNSPYLQVHAENSSHVGLNSSKSGSGTTQNLVFQIDGVTKAYLDAVSGSFSMLNSISTGGANTVKEYSANSGSAITIDPANGEAQYITLTAATPVITFASAPAAGTSKRIKLTLIQDGTGGRLPTFANCTFLATGSSTATAINSAIGSLTYFEAEAINGAWVVASANQNLGVTDGSVAAAGYIGEVISSSVAIGSATSLTTATAKSITSITLTAGDWMVSGNIGFIAAATTVPTALTASISPTNNTQATSPNDGGFAQIQATLGTASTNVLTTSPMRINITATTTYYLVGTATFTVSTLTAYGSITARRFR